MLNEKTIIPSVRDLKHLKKALKSESKFVLLSNANIGNLAELTKVCHQQGKKVLVSADLIGGFKGDREGIQLLKNLFKVDGVASNNVQILRIAKKNGLYTIYRLFMIDSRSLEHSKFIVKEENFDCVEILPGEYAYQKSADLAQNFVGKQMIAGGFISSRDLAEKILSNNYFMGITSSESSLWTREETM